MKRHVEQEEYGMMCEYSGEKKKQTKWDRSRQYNTIEHTSEMRYEEDNRPAILEWNEQNRKIQGKIVGMQD